MADTQITASVVGVDKTGATFDRIANRIDNLARRADEAYDGVGKTQIYKLTKGFELISSGNMLSGGNVFLGGLSDLIGTKVAAGFMAGFAGVKLVQMIDKEWHLSDRIAEGFSSSKVSTAIQSMFAMAASEARKLGAILDSELDSTKRIDAANAKSDRGYFHNSKEALSDAQFITAQRSKRAELDSGWSTPESRLDLAKAQYENIQRFITDVAEKQVLEHSLFSGRAQMAQSDRDAAITKRQEATDVVGIKKAWAMQEAAEKRFAYEMDRLVDLRQRQAEEDEEINKMIMRAEEEYATARAQYADDVKKRDDAEAANPGPQKTDDTAARVYQSPFASYINAAGYGAIQATHDDQPKMISVLNEIKNGISRLGQSFERLQVA